MAALRIAICDVTILWAALWPWPASPVGAADAKIGPWEVSCAVDSMTDKKSCEALQWVRIGDQSGLVSTSRFGANNFYVMITVDETVAEEAWLRIDNEPAIAAEKCRRGACVFTERSAPGLFEKMKNGEKARFRIDSYGGRIEGSFALARFAEAFAAAMEKQGQAAP